MHSQTKISSALLCLRTFKQAYKEDDGYISVGDIRDLIDNIDLIEDCVKKQKDIPTEDKIYFSLFGKKKWVRYCRSCKEIIDPGCGHKFCSKCGQRFAVVGGGK